MVKEEEVVIEEVIEGLAERDTERDAVSVPLMHTVRVPDPVLLEDCESDRVMVEDREIVREMERVGDFVKVPVEHSVRVDDGVFEIVKEGDTEVDTLSVPGRMRVGEIVLVAHPE